MASDAKGLEALRLLREVGRLDLVREEAIQAPRPARRAGWRQPFWPVLPCAVCRPRSWSFFNVFGLVKYSCNNDWDEEVLQGGNELLLTGNPHYQQQLINREARWRAVRLLEAGHSSLALENMPKSRPKGFCSAEKAIDRRD
ncbi:hypothetical protein NDU88_001595 [Pleurodeles waltl]|uniref:Uncharacterized protein n=1 Tax=Pleurodeles waltl TaxID=8319 RepID=A0AAV7SAV2_PLEWA|nr:hypothetical protein NDU88_001595 [Pleurodeles waltl]